MSGFYLVYQSQPLQVFYYLLSFISLSPNPTLSHPIPHNTLTTHLFLFHDMYVYSYVRMYVRISVCIHVTPHPTCTHSTGASAPCCRPCTPPRPPLRTPCWTRVSHIHIYTHIYIYIFSVPYHHYHDHTYIFVFAKQPSLVYSQHPIQLPHHPRTTLTTTHLP